jgi:hypothetical protein
VVPSEEVPVISQEDVFAMLRSEREDSPEVNGIFFAGIAGEGMTIAPCVEPPEITAVLLKGVFQAKHEDVLWVAHGVDTYRWTAPEPPGPEDDDFGVMFAAGDQRITEALFAGACSKDGPVWMAQQCYIAGPNGIVWDEVEDAVSDLLVARLLWMFP